MKPGSDVIEFVPLALFGFFALCGTFLLAFLLRSVVKAWIASRRKGEVSKAKAVTSEIRVTLMRTGKKKTVDIFAIL